MKWSWRWSLAAAMAVLAVVAIAVVIGTANRSTTSSTSADENQAGSVTVTVPVVSGSTLAAGSSSLGPPAVSTVIIADPDILDGTSGGRDYAVVPTPDDTAPDPSEVAEDSTPWSAPPADPTDAVVAAVADAEAAGVHQAVVVIDRATGAVLTQQSQDEQFPALSLLKLMIAADVVNGSGGAAPPDQAAVAWLQEMISRSDDITAGDFYEQAGADELVDRVIQRYGLTGSAPTPDGEYWGNVQTSAADMGSLLGQVLADPTTRTVIEPAMLASTAFAQDGVDQRFGMRTVPGAGSKQGWGCCLSGVTGIHTVGFTAQRIVVVLSSAEPDDYSLSEQDGLALQADPAGQVSIATVTNTVRAALGMPVVDFGVSVAPAADPDSAEPQQGPEEPPAEQEEEQQPVGAGGY